MPIYINGTTGISGIDGSAGTPAVQGTDTNTGIYYSAADTVDIATGGVQRGQFDSSGNFKFNSGYGSVATAYGCRAWVNFNGTGTVAIRASGNVTSITDNGVGDYTVNFTNAMPDANYSVTFGAVSVAAVDTRNLIQIKGTLAGGATTMTTTAVRIQGGDTANANTPSDSALICVSIFR